MLDGVYAKDHDILAAIGLLPSPKTETQAIIQSRVGQGKFLKKLINYWGGTCVVTAVALLPLLRASHIKPWPDSNNAELPDAYNGLLLTPSYDAAFNSGLISFFDDGSTLLSPVSSQH